MSQSNPAILLAPAPFKESLSALEATQAMARGAEEALTPCRCLLHPVSDGGEGFAETMTVAAGGELFSAEVNGPLPGQRLRAQWGYVASTRTAFIEMAQAAGLTLVPAADRDPKITTTYGVGELVRIAVGRGATSVVMGLGGSATTDGGSGMMEALGVRFLDEQGERLPRGGGARCDRDWRRGGGLHGLRCRTGDPGG